VSNLIKKVKSKLKKGLTLQSALEKVGISYYRWRVICANEGETVSLRRGKKATVYTMERVKEVKKRIKKGDFLKDICADMGMDSKNLARFCRNNGIKLFSKKALKRNYERRSKNRLSDKRKSGRSSEKVMKIEAMIKKGIKDSAIAIEIGVTRQYANLIRKKMNERMMSANENLAV